jgi:cobalt-zinc-cadmium efflux system membrane fusion protein
MSSLPRRKDVAQGTIPPSIDVMGDSSGDGTAIARLLKGSRELRRAAWVASEGRVEALFHDDEVETLGIGAEATFSPSRAPEVRVRLIRTSLPPVGAHRSTSWLAFDIQGDATATHPGEAGWVLATALTREILTIPSSAVQPSPTGPYVFVSSGKVGAFTRRDIQIGDDDHGLVSVISGLRKGERVATRNAFFLDAELLLRADSASAFSR